MDNWTDAESTKFIEYLYSNGYFAVIPKGYTEFACLAPFAYTTAIITGQWGDRAGYSDRWYFDSPKKALVALMKWAIDDFNGEPQGWHRHPDSGRRRPDG